MKVAALIFVATIIATVKTSPNNRTKQTANVCETTLTTASGRFAPKGQLCKNQLIFDEQFNHLNLDLWGHEVKLKSFVREFNIILFILKRTNY